MRAFSALTLAHLAAGGPDDVQLVLVGITEIGLVITTRLDDVVRALIGNMLIGEFPISGTFSIPAALQIDEDFQVAHAAPISGLDVIVQGVDSVAETDTEVIVRDKIINKVI